MSWVNKAKEVAGAAKETAAAPFVAVAGGTNATKNYLDPTSKTGFLGQIKQKGFEIFGEEERYKKLAAAIAAGRSGNGADAMPYLNEMRTLDPRALLQQPGPLGQSQWANFALQKQTADQARGLDNAVQQQQQALAAARAGAMGRGSGAGEMLANQGGLDLLKLRQGQNQQGLLARTGLMQQAAGKQLDTDKFNTAVSSDISRTNLANQIQDIGKENEFGTTRYGEQMKLLSAAKTADAMKANAKNGGGKK